MLFKFLRLRLILWVIAYIFYKDNNKKTVRDNRNQKQFQI